LIKSGDAGSMDLKVPWFCLGVRDEPELPLLVNTKEAYLNRASKIELA
jgi:hypothetical protein